MSRHHTGVDAVTPPPPPTPDPPQTKGLPKDRKAGKCTYIQPGKRHVCTLSCSLPLEGAPASGGGAVSQQGVTSVTCCLNVSLCQQSQMLTNVFCYFLFTLRQPGIYFLFNDPHTRMPAESEGWTPHGRPGPLRLTRTPSSLACHGGVRAKGPRLGLQEDL